MARHTEIQVDTACGVNHKPLAAAVIANNLTCCVLAYVSLAIHNTVTTLKACFSHSIYIIDRQLNDATLELK